MECDKCGQLIERRNIWKKTRPECGKVIQPTEKLMEHMVSIHELKTPHSIKKGSFFHGLNKDSCCQTLGMWHFNQRLDLMMKMVCDICGKPI